MLELCRQSLIEAFNGNLDSVKSFILKQILGEDESVPLVVVKAVGTNYDIITAENDIKTFLPTVQSVKAIPLSTKQNWQIQLKSKTDTMKLNMSTRTNKPKPLNKIAQGYNLAVKFVGLEK